MYEAILAKLHDIQSREMSKTRRGSSLASFAIFLALLSLFTLWARANSGDSFKLG
jgi:hypothetical protein